MALSAARVIESKGAFAKRRGVSAGRVSQWIGEGKIPVAALVGTGATAQIDVAVAEAHLDRVLHPGQLLARAAQQLQASAPAPDPMDQAGPAQRDMALRLQELKLEEAEDARLERQRKRLREAGEFVPAEDARRAWAKQMAELVRAIDGWLLGLGQAVALEAGCDAKPVTIRLRHEWRQFRLRLVAEAEAAAAAEPELVDLPDHPDAAQVQEIAA